MKLLLTILLLASVGARGQEIVIDASGNFQSRTITKGVPTNWGRSVRFDDTIPLRNWPPLDLVHRETIDAWKSKGFLDTSLTFIRTPYYDTAYHWQHPGKCDQSEYWKAKYDSVVAKYSRFSHLPAERSDTIPKGESQWIKPKR